MRKVALLLAFLAWVSHGRRAQMLSDRLQRSPLSELQEHGRSQRLPPDSLARLLLALKPTAGFKPLTPGKAQLLRAVQPTMVLGYPSVAFKSTGDSYGRWVNIFDRLLQDRVVFLGQQLDDENIRNAVASLLYLDSENGGETINLYINTPGGNVISCLALYDTMGSISSPCATCNMGQAAAMGSLLLSAGERGKRVALPHSRVLLKAPSGQTQGQAEDIKTDSEMILKVTDMLVRAYTQTTGQPIEKIRQDMDRDNHMNAQEALEYGLIDKILVPQKS